MFPYDVRRCSPGFLVMVIQFTSSKELYSVEVTAPSQPQEPITLTPSPEWPFQQIVMDIFHVSHVAYLAFADRLTC